MATTKKTTYTGADIQVLEGLEPVRKRPAMYIGGTDSTGYHHLLWEIVDNSVDEVINGHATQRRGHAPQGRQDASPSTDDGRGIPVDIIPSTRSRRSRSSSRTLHAGGKFEQGNYIHSGGLHGVGSSVVNALSRELVVRRSSATASAHVQTLRARQAHQPSSRRQGTARGTGTSITFEPDPEIFGEKLKFDAELDPRAARGQELPAQGPDGRLHATRRPART